MWVENMTERNKQVFLPEIPPLQKQVWRYIDFTQLISILERESLWFNRADQFEDPLEGSFSRATVKTRESRYENWDVSVDMTDILAKTAKLFRKTAYLNCWHLNSYESAAMWDQYSINGRGIAIQTTVENLMKSLTSEPGIFINGEDTPDDGDKIDEIFTFGKVRYIDYDKHLIPENNANAPVFHKRLSFEHEQEFRIAYSVFGDKLREWEGVSGINESDVETPVGEYIDADIDILIDTLYVSPTSPEWFSELVDMVVERYDLNCEIQKSSLDEDPVF